MNRVSGFSTVTVCAAIVCLAVGVDAKDKGPLYQPGVLIAAYARGGAPTFESKSSTKGKSTAYWWYYCIGSGNKTYVGASRESPAQLGLTVKGPLEFVVEKTRLQVINSEGKRYFLTKANSPGERDCR